MERQKEEDVKVMAAKCKCGLARAVAVMEPDGTYFSKETENEFMRMQTKGYKLCIIGLEEARTIGLCFESCAEK